MKHNFTGRAVFLIGDHHCNMENVYLPGCFFGGSGGFQAISWVCQECLDVILEYITGVSRVFLGPFCQIEFASVASLYKSKPFLQTPKHRHVFLLSQ